ncbi:hypothetical protein O6H91_20G043400 [Diphasiastrum complanatum]|uniref:Uncharacterized protein n=2 Tax=Diphasiastrum complanatum TaxID=34168 RepID=A0ACC2APJ8_DIPCM|nr:hypothetical protein O6H91_20G043400 [Diphasiastrum complanatum]
MDAIHTDALDTFVNITGASEAIGLQILQANGGDLNAAINAYFNTRDQSLPSLQREDADRNEYMEEDDVVPVLGQPTVQLHDPFSVPVQQISSWNRERPTFEANLGLLTEERSSSRVSGIGTAPQVSYPREVRDIPIDWHDEADASSRLRPVRQPFLEIEEITTHDDLHQGAAPQGIVSMDDDPPSPTLPLSRLDGEPIEIHPFGGIAYAGNRDYNQFAPQVAEVPPSVYEDVNDVEEEMLRAAIEASKKEAEGAVPYRQEAFETGTRQVGFLGPGAEDDDLARAVSLSLKTAEREKALREQLLVGAPQAHDDEDDNPFTEDLKKLGIYKRGGSASASEIRQAGTGQVSIAKYPKMSGSSSSSPEEVEEPEDQPLLRRRARRTSSSGALQPTATPTNSSDDVAVGSQQDILVPQGIHGSSQEQVPTLRQHNGGLFQADEWGGISSEEHDEAVMLEAALFGGLPESALLGIPYQSHRGHDAEFESSGDDLPPTEAFNSRRPYPQQPSPSVVAQRLLREQQDDEYLASLAADREKDMKAMLEAEARRAEEEAAAAAASAEEKLRRQEELNQRNAIEELARELSAKKARLPPEPAADDENSVTLLVRLPDGSRRGRRFQKSDKLQCLFDFIDVSGGVNPGTYRLVRQYPRRAFHEDELSSSFSSLGLTNKQEALFLEII